MDINANERAPSRGGQATMKTRRSRLLGTATAIALGAMACLPGNANAAVSAVTIVADPAGEIQTQATIAEIIASAGTVLSGIQTQTLETLQALRLFSSQGTANARTQTQAQAQMMDTWDARETQRRQVDWRMQGTVRLTPGASVCNVITGSVSARNSFVAVSRWREEIAAQQQDYTMGASNATAARRGAAAAVEQRNALHCEVAATQYDVDIGLCPAVTAPALRTDTNDTLALTVGRDLSAGSVLSPVNLTLSEADRRAANAFLMHAFNGRPLGAMPNGSAATEQGRRLAAENMTSVAQRSVAQSFVSTVLADRAAMPGTGGTSGTAETSAAGGQAGSTSIASWAEGTARQTIGYKSEGTNFPDGVSRAAYLKLRAMAWFWNPNWASAVGQQAESQTLKDIAMIQAYSVYQNWEMYQLTERMGMTLATMLTIMEERNRAPGAQ